MAQPEGKLWRFGASREAQTFDLNVPIHRLFPIGGTVELLSDTKILHLTGNSLTVVTDLEERPRDVARCGNGYVVLTRELELFYHEGRSEPRPLNAWWRVDDDLSKPLTPVEVRLDNAHGQLHEAGPDRVVWITDHPYEVTILRLDGVASKVVVDESRFDVALSQPTSEDGNVRTTYSPAAFAKDGLLFVVRIWRTYVEHGDTEFILPRSFIDVIDEQTGKVIKRVRVTGDDFGQLAGIRDADTLVLLRSAWPGRPGAVLSVPWRDMPEADLSSETLEREVKATHQKLMAWLATQQDE